MWSAGVEIKYCWGAIVNAAQIYQSLRAKIKTALELGRSPKAL